MMSYVQHLIRSSSGFQRHPELITGTDLLCGLHAELAYKESIDKYLTTRGDLRVLESTVTTDEMLRLSHHPHQDALMEIFFRAGVEVPVSAIRLFAVALFNFERSLVLYVPTAFTVVPGQIGPRALLHVSIPLSWFHRAPSTLRGTQIRVHQLPHDDYYEVSLDVA
jgi:hypothetical protein